jgi:hypothetical protein
MRSLVRWIVGSWVAALTCGVAAGDWRIQTDLVNGVARIEACLTQGQHAEAEAYAQMILLKEQVRVCVEFGGVIDPALGARLVENATQTWSEALGGQVLFVLVPSNQADVHVRFARSVWVDAARVSGSANWRRGVLRWGPSSFTYQVAASIEISTESPFGGPASEEAMTQALLHEFGHVLGLTDSPRVGDVMGPLRLDKPATRPTEAEVLSLLQLRSQATSLLAQAQAQSFVSKAPVDR